MSTIVLPPATTQQLRFLRALLVNPETWKRYEYLIDVVWGDDPDGGPENPSNGLRVMVFNLRKRLARHGVSPDCIETAWGTGYRIVEEHRASVVELLAEHIEMPNIARDPEHYAAMASD